MPFKIGDKVAVLDEDITGVVQKVTVSGIIVDTNDGFLLNFSPSEIILQNASGSLSDNIFYSTDVKSTIKDKEQKKGGFTKKLSKKEKAKPAMEVDLHIHQLVKSSKGLSNFEMLNIQLDTAKQKLEFAIKKRIQRIVFIHGVGTGILKLELETLFRRYDNIKYYDASYQKYGLGATEVYIYQNKN